MVHCRSCSAPLRESSPVCAYCGVVNEVDLRRVHQYTESSPDSRRVCPECGTILSVLDVSAQVERKFLVERCEKCLGLFFDTGELEALLEAVVAPSGNIDFARLGEMGKSAPPDQVKYHKCPVCEKLMNRLIFGARSGVITDQCGAHGIWLQAGELNRLLDWRKSGGSLLNEQLQKEKERAALKAEEERKKRLEKLKRDAAAYGEPNPF